MRCIADTAPGAPIVRWPDDRPGVALRGFRPTDVPFIAAIVADALHEHYDPALYHSLSAEWADGFLVAADPRDVPVGFLLGVNQVEREARILMFAVDRGHRTAGVGTLLMSAFLERCRARGFARVTLEVRVSNATAIRFYTRYRYAVTDLLRAYYSDGENGYQMARAVD
ncbi:MAG TPA: GNAT family N-acetyltransferase [Thermoplasmata archaeon]|nr:GNAT family N-acetyltransferase [Thermoplasmata archaeon]